MIDQQDPLPEPSWLWRRWYTFLVTFAILGLIALAVILMPAEQLRWVCLALIALVVLLATYYLIAPSAEHIVSTVQAWRSRGGPAGDDPPAT